MDKQKLFRVLSFLGLFFTIYAVVNFVQLYKNRGEAVQTRVEVPDAFARDFSRVITKNRLQPMKETAFLNPNGQQISWSEFQGKYLLVNFWASWCSPCVTELPSLDALQQRFAGKGLEVIAISLDMGRNHHEIKEYLYNRNIGLFAAYFDNKQDVQRNISMRGIPTTYLLDPDGNVLHVFEGDANWKAPAALNYFTDLLTSSGT